MTRVKLEPWEKQAITEVGAIMKMKLSKTDQSRFDAIRSNHSELHSPAHDSCPICTLIRFVAFLLNEPPHR